MLERNKSSPGHPTASALTVQGVWKRHNFQVARVEWQQSRLDCTRQSGNNCIWGPSAGSSMFPGEKNVIVLDWHDRNKVLSA